MYTVWQLLTFAVWFVGFSIFTLKGDKWPYGIWGLCFVLSFISLYVLPAIIIFTYVLFTYVLFTYVLFR